MLAKSVNNFLMTGYTLVDKWLLYKIATNKIYYETKYDKLRRCRVEGQIPFTYTQAVRILFNKQYL